MGDYDEILQLAQRLEHEARGLQPSHALLPGPHPTLRTQRKKFDDMELSSAFSARVGGHVPVARVNLRHKKSEELALHSLRVDWGPVIDYDSEDDAILDVNSTVDDVVARAHVRSLNRSLERSQRGKSDAAKRLHWAHDEADFNVATARLSELSSMRRALQMQGRALRLGAGVLGRGPTTHWGAQGTGAAPHVGADWRSSDYKCVMDAWVQVPTQSLYTSLAPLYAAGGAANQEKADEMERSLGKASEGSAAVDAPTWGALVGMFKQLVAKGPHGVRNGPEAGSLLELWDSIAAVVGGSTRRRAKGVSRQASMADAARAHLERQYREYISNPGDAEAKPDGTGTSRAAREVLHSLALTLQQRDPNVMGYAEPVCWLLAYLALRAGEVGCLQECLAESGDAAAVQLAAEVPAHWPMYETVEGELRERPPAPTAKRLAAELTAYDYEADPYRCAVVLILSRSATVSAQAALWHQVSKREVTQYVQDRIWLNLALCASSAHSNGAPKEGPQQPYTLHELQLQASHAKVADFPCPFLYLQAMAWSGAVPMVVHALVPPTLLEGLAEYALEGLHMSLLLVATLCVADEACIRRVHRALEEYITKLVPFSADVATLYMRLMPNAAEAILTRLCANTDACHALLGYVGVDGQVHGGAVQDIFTDEKQRAQVVLSIGNSLRESGDDIFQASEVLLVALGTGGEQQAVRALVAHLKVSLVKVVNELDGTGTHSACSVEVLRSLDMAGPHLERYEKIVEEVKALRHLHCLSLLCCAVASRNPTVWDLVQQVTSLGLFPADISDVPRCAAEVNTQCEVSSVRTALPVAVSMALSAIAQELQAPSSQALGPIKRRLLEAAQALLLYATQLRVPVSMPTTSRIQAARIALSQLAA
eukprot:TRINITY_DN17958_c0_g1_i1.p1 TRINITY_DN17958_c0_g1~~TRINITY_DN17958_c0_g1_i1.p1  ORF type:complete len:882 (+),score=327.48 TRINITY_DN17958_c0_g1_i1:108-2753(+)